MGLTLVLNLTSLQSADPCRGLCQNVLGPLVGTDEHLNLPFLLLRWGWHQSPHAPLPAKVTLPSDAGSFDLVIDGAAHCLATGGPDVMSAQHHLLSGVKYQSGGGHVSKRHRLPTEDCSASCIWSGFLYCCFPLLSTLLFQTWNSLTNGSRFL